MDEELQDITWLDALSAGLDAAQRGGRMVILHPCGQGIGATGDL
jgi:hypothetical protein